jgi:hypothetical protein
VNITGTAPSCKAGRLVDRQDFISFPAEFGSMYVASQRIAEMVWSNNSECQLTLESGKSVDAKQSCNEVHKALLPK